MAGMASMAMLMAPGCGGGGGKAPISADEPLRRANYRSLAARDFLVTCDGGAERSETAAAVRRHEELVQLGGAKDAGYVLALGENDWAAMSRHDDRATCARGEAAWHAAFADYDRALDVLAGRIADYRESAQ
jgi:hypothetical protein